MFSAGPAAAQGAARTLVAVFAHADDEGAAAPILARYAREGAQVYLVIATDGAQGGAHTSIPRGPELARVRSEEARCAADALGIHAPILLGFPDAQLGNYMEDPARLFQLTARVQEELQRLRPDAVITWGPDGATGHPDHRIVSSVVTQLVRAGAPGAPERLFYVSLPVEGFRAMNPTRGEPPFLIPLAKYFSARVSFSTADLEASRRSMACHKTQYSDDTVQRVSEAMRGTLKGELPLAPLFTRAGTTDLFRYNHTEDRTGGRQSSGRDPPRHLPLQPTSRHPGRFSLVRAHSASATDGTARSFARACSPIAVRSLPRCAIESSTSSEVRTLRPVRDVVFAT